MEKNIESFWILVLICGICDFNFFDKIFGYICFDKKKVKKTEVFLELVEK